MKYYNMDTRGYLKVPILDNLPEYNNELHERNIVYNINDHNLYYGNDNKWINLEMIDVSRLVGVINPNNLPTGTISKLIIVQNQAERFSLTTEQISYGDTVKENNTNLVYFVKNVNELDNSSGYELYTSYLDASFIISGILNIDRIPETDDLSFFHAMAF